MLRWLTHEDLRIHRILEPVRGGSVDPGLKKMKMDEVRYYSVVGPAMGGSDLGHHGSWGRAQHASETRGGRDFRWSGFWWMTGSQINSS